MKTVLALLCIVYLAYADEYIKSIEDEVYKIKKFEKYKDAPYPKPDFMEIGNIKLLGWSQNNYFAYLLDSPGVNMGDDNIGTLYIKDMYNNKIIYSKQFIEELGGNDNVNFLYEKFEKEIKKTLKEYHIKSKKRLLHKNSRYIIKNIYKKSPYPLGFGNFKKYLESVNIYVDKNGKKKLCSSEIMNEEYWDGKEKRIDYNTLDASLLGAITSPTNKDVTAVAIAYVQKNGAEGNSVDIKILSCNTSNTKMMHINNSTYKSLYSFCKATGIKESEIRALNPWINKKATNIPHNAKIIIPNLSKEENNESK